MPKGRTYETLRADIESIPVIDTHEHFTGPDSQEGHKEPIKSVTSGYVHSDIMSADGWLGIDQARQVAADWLFNNPNELFKLGFEPVSV